MDLSAAYDSLVGDGSLQEKKNIISTTTNELFSLMDGNVSRLQTSLGAQKYVLLKNNIHICLDSIYRDLQYLGFMKRDMLMQIRALFVLYFSDRDLLLSLEEKLTLLRVYINDIHTYTIGLKHHLDLVDDTSSNVKVWMQNLSEFEGISDYGELFQGILRKRHLLETLLDTSSIAHSQYDNAITFYTNLCQLHSELTYVTQNFHNISLLQQKKQSIQDIFSKI